VFSNLLDNAIKFTPAGKRISVGVRQQGDNAVLQVSDEGEGLAPGLIDTAFGLFVQGERGLDRAAGGLGVGLALVKRLTELHGGSVSAASAGPGKGATFTVTLPAVLPSPKPATPEPRIAIASRRVLIVEDNDDTRQMLHQVLVFSGHDVREARDGAEGLAASQGDAPDLVVCDLFMPEMDGLVLLGALRRLRPVAKAVFVSDEAGHDWSGRAALLLGASGVLNKPPAPGDLLDAVRRALAAP
jgi:CheY-like chemotaxis protein